MLYGYPKIQIFHVQGTEDRRRKREAYKDRCWMTDDQCMELQYLVGAIVGTAYSMLHVHNRFHTKIIRGISFQKWTKKSCLSERQLFNFD